MRDREERERGKREEIKRRGRGERGERERRGERGERRERGERERGGERVSDAGRRERNNVYVFHLSQYQPKNKQTRRLQVVCYSPFFLDEPMNGIDSAIC